MVALRTVSGMREHCWNPSAPTLQEAAVSHCVQTSLNEAMWTLGVPTQAAAVLETPLECLVSRTTPLMRKIPSITPKSPTQNS